MRIKTIILERQYLRRLRTTDLKTKQVYSHIPKDHSVINFISCHKANEWMRSARSLGMDLIYFSSIDHVFAKVKQLKTVSCR